MFEKLKDCAVIVILLFALATIVDEVYWAAHLIVAVTNMINGVPAESILSILVHMVAGIAVVALLHWLMGLICDGELFDSDSRLGRWFEHRSEAKERKRQQEIESADPAHQLAIQTKRIQTVQQEVEEALSNIEKKSAFIHEEVLKTRFLVMTLNEQIKIAASNQQDDVARDLIQEKQKQQDRLDQLEASLSLAQKNQDKVQKMLDILAMSDISQRDKQWDIGILNEVARAQKVVTDLYQSMGIQSHYKN